MSISKTSNSEENHPLLPTGFQSFSNPQQTVSRVVQGRIDTRASTSSTLPLGSRTVDGQYKLNLPDGEYVGQIENDEPHGEGTLNYKPGMMRKKYVGAWKKGQFWGKGMLLLTNGGRYEGDFERGWPHGKGIAFLPDGSRFEGEFKCGHVQGRGKAYKRDGKIEEGEWLNGYKVLNPFQLGYQREYEFLE